MTTPSETVQAAQRLLAEREAAALMDFDSIADRVDLSSATAEIQRRIEHAADLLLCLIRLRETMPVTMREAVGELHITPPTAFGDIARAAADVVMTAPAWSTPSGRHARRAAERDAYTARWANAPEWALFLGQDSDESCIWYRSKPELYGPPGRQAWLRGGMIKRAGHNLLGRVACESRPQPAVDLEREAFRKELLASVESQVQKDMDRAAYLKRWEAAPEWAQWLAEAEGGDCIWLQTEPSDGANGWEWRAGKVHTAGRNKLGRIGFEPRPEVQP